MDELNTIFISNWQSITEALYVSSLSNRLNSYVNGSMMLG
jgi:hypothetical protein